MKIAETLSGAMLLTLTTSALLRHVNEQTWATVTNFTQENTISNQQHLSRSQMINFVAVKILFLAAPGFYHKHAAAFGLSLTTATFLFGGMGGGATTRRTKSCRRSTAASDLHPTSCASAIPQLSYPCVILKC